MSERALVLSGDPWEMKDERTGELIKGNSLWYVNAYRDGDLGQKPTKVSVSDDVFKVLVGKLPAVCELDYGSRPGAQGKATLTVTGAKLFKSIDLSTFLKDIKLAA